MQAFASVERTVTYGGDAAANHDFAQRLTKHESVFFYFGDALWNIYFSDTVTTIKGRLSDFTYRNGKWGIIDSSLNQIVAYKYDCIWWFDGNELAIVNLDHLYGLVNKQGVEQVPVIYDDIDRNDDGTYTVKQNGQEFRIDKFGNRI